MSDDEIYYIPKGEPYPEERYFVGQSSSWSTAQIAIKMALTAQAKGYVPPHFKLRVWKNPNAFPSWFMEWRPKKEKRDDNLS